MSVIAWRSPLPLSAIRSIFSANCGNFAASAERAKPVSSWASALDKIRQTVSLSRPSSLAIATCVWPTILRAITRWRFASGV